MRQTMLIAGAILFAGLLIAGAILLTQQQPAQPVALPDEDDDAQEAERELARELERQIVTIENLQKFGQSIEQYIMDFNRVGSPKIGDIDIAALQDIFRTLGINLNDALMKDGWGNDFIYDFDALIGGKRYTLISYGADGAPGPEPVRPGVVKRLEEDIIWVNGHFSQRPEGSMSPR